MLQQARDEAHRFAVTYNRKRRSLRTVTSELLSIPGIGPSKRRLLLQTFGSVQGVRDATVDQIAALPGFSAVTAGKLLELLTARREAGPPDPTVAAAETGRADDVEVTPNVPAAPDDDSSAVHTSPRTPDTP